MNLWILYSVYRHCVMHVRGIVQACYMQFQMLPQAMVALPGKLPFWFKVCCEAVLQRHAQHLDPASCCALVVITGSCASSDAIVSRYTVCHLPSNQLSAVYRKIAVVCGIMLLDIRTSRAQLWLLLLLLLFLVLL